MSARDGDIPEHITIAHLHLVFFRGQGQDGRWGAVSADTATDQQFGEWAHSRLRIDNDDGRPWSAEERAEFCDLLYRMKALVIPRCTLFDKHTHE